MLYRGEKSIRSQSRYIRRFGFCSRGVVNRTKSITMSPGWSSIKNQLNAILKAGLCKLA